MSSPTAATLPARTTPPSNEPANPQGASFGRYILLEVLGRGGMGTVHAAYDSQLDRKVAIKMLHPNLLEDAGAADFCARMVREAQAMARLSHPNVVTVHEVGTIDGTVFLAMEYVKGSTLRKWLDAPRSLAERIAVLKAAGRGLAAAHSAGIVHRDFKPDNVLVGDDGRVCVSDFGIARGVESSGDEARQVTRTEETGPARELDAAVTAGTLSAGGPLLDAPLTHSGSVLGSVGYMAPEQAHGERADARADQFGFCAALYFALYDVKPFPARDFAGYVTSLGEPIPAPPPDSKVPLWLRRVVLRGLSPSPEDRYPTMAGLLSALDDDPAIRRRRWLVASALVLAALVLGLGAMTLRRAPPALCTMDDPRVSAVWNPARRGELQTVASHLPRQPAGDPLARTASLLDDYTRGVAAMRTEACVATRVRGEQSDEVLGLRMDCLDDRLREVDALVSALAKGDADAFARGPQAAQALGLLSTCADVAGLKAPVRLPADEATRKKVEDLRGLIATANSEIRLGHYAAARDLAASAAKDASSTRYAPVEAEALFSLGDAQLSFGDARQAAPTMVLAQAAAISGNDATIATLSLAGLVVADSVVGHFEEGHVFADLGEAWGARADVAARGEIASASGRLLYAERKLEPARVGIERAISLQTSAYGKDDVRVAWSVTLLADVYLALGDYGGAKSQNERAIGIIAAATGGESPLMAPNLNNLGGACFGNADYDCAIAAFRRAHDVYVQTYGSEFFANAITLNNLAEAIRAKGDPRGALPLNEEAVAILERSLGKGGPNTAGVLASLAETQRQAGDDLGALVTFGRALAIEEKALGPDHPDLATPLTGIGMAHLDQKRPDLARSPLLRALALREAHPGDPFDRGETRFALARALVRTAPARARSLALQARSELASAGPRGVLRANDVGSWLASL